MNIFKMIQEYGKELDKKAFRKNLTERRLGRNIETELLLRKSGQLKMVEEAYKSGLFSEESISNTYSLNLREKMFIKRYLKSLGKNRRA